MSTEHSDLIIGYLEGRLNNDELNRFFIWLEIDSSNKKLFFETKAIFDSISYPEIEKDVHNSWERLSKKRKKHHLFFKGVISHAVAAIVAILITFAFINFKREPELITKHFGSNGLEADVIELSDGTKITLGPKSTIAYNSLYGKSERKVLLEGEAYFQIAKQKNKPFKVIIDGQEIKALGTRFNVTAYPKDSLFVTTLLEGVVQLTTGKQKTLLNPDQQLIYNKIKNTITIKQVDADYSTEWTTGYYHFYEQNLRAILNRMGNVYGVDFEIKSNKINDKLFTGTFYRGQNIKDILQVIHLSVPIKWKMEKNKIDIHY